MRSVEINGKKYWAIVKAGGGACEGCAADGDQGLCDALPPDCMAGVVVWTRQEPADNVVVVEVYRDWGSLMPLNVIVSQEAKKTLSQVIGAYGASLGEAFSIEPDRLKTAHYIWPSQMEQLMAALKRPTNP